jgi:hypothetical protein
MVCLAECHFLDVGQGSSNVILLGDGRAMLRLITWAPLFAA